MSTKFYSMGARIDRTVITISTKVDVSTRTLIPLDTELKTNNVFSIAGGKKWLDIITFQDNDQHFAISKRFKQLLEDHDVKGWSCFPIVLKDSEEEYFLFLVTSKAGKILNLDALNKYQERHLQFDLSTWDGSGIFTLEETLHIVCTEEVKEIIESADITNISFREL